MKSQELAKAKLPAVPGVYFFRKGKDILYIGKATSLRDRTRSYFSADLIETRGPMIVDMVFKADSITWEETDTVIEALILEAALIRRHMPYYNVKEKDDKSWNYALITKERLPQVLTVRGRDLESLKEGNPPESLKGVKTDDTYGPFTSGVQFKEAMKIIRRIFPYLDRTSAKSDNYEFYRQIHLAPDISDDDACKAYKKNITNIKLFFGGRKQAILKSLEKDMKAAAKSHNFEEAARMRNQIFSLKHINDVALLKNDVLGRKQKAGFRIEAYDVAHLSGKNMIGVMTVIEDGEINKKEYRTFNIKGFSDANDTGALEEILSRRFRHTEWGMPDLVVTDGGEAQLRVGCQVLKRYQLAIPVVSVVKDNRHKPKDILGDEKFAKEEKKNILLANSEAHRFSIRLHRNKRDKEFIKK